MLLAIDVGNSHTVFGIFERETLVASWRVATVRDRTADELGIIVGNLLSHRQLGPQAIGGIVMASVVPQLTTPTMEMAATYFGREALNVDPGSGSPIPILYDKPSDVGADRIVNAVSALERHGPARPLIIVDFGTATTFDAISRAGEYLGGVICPGVQISADALFRRAARLPLVDVRKPAHVIGRSTIESMQSGLFFGYVGMVEGLVTKMKGELGSDTVCIATGGLADLIAPETGTIDVVDQDLTLHGLRILWEARPRRASVASGARSV